MLTIDITMFIQIVEALLMMLILNAILIKPVMKIFKERENTFQNLKEDIDKFSKGADQVLKQYQERLQQARIEASQKKEALKAKAHEEEKNILEKAYKEAEDLKTKTLSQLSFQLEQVRKELKNQVEKFAASIAEKLLGRSL